MAVVTGSNGNSNGNNANGIGTNDGCEPGCECQADYHRNVLTGQCSKMIVIPYTVYGVIQP